MDPCLRRGDGVADPVTPVFLVEIFLFDLLVSVLSVFSVLSV
jgi:hypothetical protein